MRLQKVIIRNRVQRPAVRRRRHRHLARRPPHPPQVHREVDQNPDRVAAALPLDIKGGGLDLIVAKVAENGTLTINDVEKDVIVVEVRPVQGVYYMIVNN